jgi:hypothetical protein
MAKRKSRAKWQRGDAFLSIYELLWYVRRLEDGGTRRQDIMVYCPWGVQYSKSTPANHRGVRPTSIMVLFNMPLSLVERLAGLGRIFRAQRREPCPAS